MNTQQPYMPLSLYERVHAESDVLHATECAMIDVTVAGHEQAIELAGRESVARTVSGIDVVAFHVLPSRGETRSDHDGQWWIVSYNRYGSDAEVTAR